MSDELERRVKEAERLTRIEAKLDSCLAEITDTKEYVRGVSERVRVLEAWRNWAVGIGTAVASLAGYFKWGNT